MFDVVTSRGHMNTTTSQNTPVAADSLIARLFRAGAHYGFTKSRRHPTVTPFLFGDKQGVDIIDLEKTQVSLAGAQAFLTDLGMSGKTVLFVSTKEEISSIVESFALKAEMPFVIHRWVGGMLTNFAEMKKRIQRLADLTAQAESGELERKYTKKERVLIGREMRKLEHNFGGITKMDRTPSCIVVVDPRHDAVAVTEAQALSIPVIAITSSDANIQNITYPIVANDALRDSVSLLLNELTESYLKGVRENSTAKK